MLDFCPSDIGAKGKGREVQCRAAGLSYKDVCKFFVEASPENFQAHYNAFVKEFPREAKVISNLRGNGIGPGEMLIWFLFDNVSVGGANASCDLLIDGKDFAEVKGGTYSRPKHRLYDFKLSKDQAPSVKFVVNAINALEGDGDIGRIDRDGNFYVGTNFVCRYDDADFRHQVEKIISARQRNDIDIKIREQIVEQWKNMIFTEYLDGKTMVLLQANNLHMWYFGELTKEMVGLYRLNRNQPWAYVNLPGQKVM